MDRLKYAFATFALLFAVSCGGGTTTLPIEQGDPGAENPGLNDFTLPIAPTSVVGDHSVSIVPGQLNVVTGTDEAGLVALAAKYGYEVLYQDGPRATLLIPETADVEAVAKQFAKEYNIVSAEPVHRINTPVLTYESIVTARTASFTPLDPFYATIFNAFPFDDGAGGTGWGNRPGPALPMNVMGFNAAWDVSLNLAVASEPVVVAIIDAGWYDYSTVDRAGLDETILDAANSGFVDDVGTFTPGLDAAVWDTFASDEGGNFWARPYRDHGERILGILAATINDYAPYGYDWNGENGIEEDEIWNEGIAGINPNATYMLIKTGELNVDTWSFTDNHLAESIDHAVAAGANIIILGMFGNGAVGANLSTAILNARDNNVLVIAPAGDIVTTFDGDSGTFTGTTIDIMVNPVSPASDANCVSVTGTGYFRAPTDLADQDGVPNGANGWDFNFYVDAFADPFHEVARYNNTGADMAAISWGIGFGQHPIWYAGGDGTEGDPLTPIPGPKYETFSLDAWGTVYCAAYVAGAASQVFQTLSFVNGIPPTDDEVLAELTSTVQLPNLAGTDGGGLLNAGWAMTSAINGGSLQTILPAMQFSSVILSQPLAAVTRGTDLSFTATVNDGTGPFSFEIDWGNGDPPVTVDPWTNGDPVTLSGGYDALGLKGINLTVTDTDGKEASVGFEIHVINPLAVNITISDEFGVGVPLLGLQAGTQYRFKANATNVYTGAIEGVPNTTTFNWYFQGLDPIPFPYPAADETGPSPVFAFPTPGSYDLILIVSEDVRPHSIFSITLSVS